MKNVQHVENLCQTSSLKKKINPPIKSILKKNNQQKYNKKSVKLEINS